MEDYKKKYDELLLKLQKAKVDDNVCDEMYYRVIDNIVPELKESEDEKIRKVLIDYFKRYKEQEECGIKIFYGIPADDILAWLEKQGEQKQDPCDNCKDVMLNCHNFPCVKKRAYTQGKSVLKVIKEEPQVYKTEDGEIITYFKTDGYKLYQPKFKVGDWVILTVGELSVALQIVNVDTNKKRYWFNDNSYLSIDDEECLHLYTIEDAKDGDVLNSPSHHLIWIYKDNEHYYACVNMNYVTENVDTDGLISIPKDACPATKEQRRQLEKVMADTGYTFDFDKKELKKIVTPKFKIGDTMRTLQEASNGITSGLPVVVSIDNEYYHCNNELIAIKNQDDYEFPPMNKKPTAWSEEDEKKRNLLIDILNVNHPNGVFKVNPVNTSNMEAMHTEELVSWLKSLKDRCTWKPSDEQIKALEHFVRSVGESGYASHYDNNTKLLYSLLSDLKKLK